MHTNTQTAPRMTLAYHPDFASDATQQHPIIKAFENIQYGQLFLKTPEGYVHNFMGRKIGPVAYLYVHDWKTFDDFLARGETGLAESYMEGLWDSPNLPVLLTFGLENAEALEDYFYGKPVHVIFSRLASLVSGNSIKGSRKNIMTHYDLGNDFYKLWLDDSMTYSCALFGAEIDMSLEEAQRAKYRRILRKLGAKPGEHILDIGCGWGAFAEVAAREGIKVTGITLSEQQKVYADERLHKAGLHELTHIELTDYREVKGMFDHVVSIGMFEHVGERYWPSYFNTIKARLKVGGKAMVQSITLDHNVFHRTHGKYSFIEQCIFPGGALPSREIFQDTLNRAGLRCNEMFTFGQNYVQTLHRWLENFDRHEKQIRHLGYGEKFVRMWRMYLAGCIASFTTGRTDVMQAELMHK